MKKLFLLLSLGIAAACFVACGDAQTSLDISTSSYGQKSLGMFTWHGTAKPATFVTDDGQEYTVKTLGNYGVGLKADSAYRMTIYFAAEKNSNKATLYQLAHVPVLGDSTHIEVKSDKLSKIGSIWMGGGYINATLHFPHDGSPVMMQTVAYRIDKTEPLGSARNIHISLLYLQNSVPARYDESICVSIDPKRLKVQPGDRITLHTETKDYGIDQKTFDF